MLCRSLLIIAECKEKFEGENGKKKKIKMSRLKKSI